MRDTKEVISKKSGLISKEIFEEVGVVNVSRKKQSRIIKILAKGRKTTKLTHLIKYHEKKCVSWLKKYLKKKHF